MPAWRPREDWLRAAVASALDEEACPLELVVVDDGSEEPVAPLLEDVIDPRLRVVRIEHGGSAPARNAGGAASRGTHIRYVDADDVVEPGSTAACSRSSATPTTSSRTAPRSSATRSSGPSGRSPRTSRATRSRRACSAPSTSGSSRCSSRARSSSAPGEWEPLVRGQRRLGLRAAGARGRDGAPRPRGGDALPAARQLRDPDRGRRRGRGCAPARARPLLRAASGAARHRPRAARLRQAGARPRVRVRLQGRPPAGRDALRPRGETASRGDGVRGRPLRRGVIRRAARRAARAARRRG